MQPYDQGWGQPQQQPSWGQPAQPPQGWGAPQQGPPPGWGQQPPAPQPPAVTPPSADDFMTGGHRSAKFDTFGQVIGGEIVEAPKVEQQTDPKTRAPQFYPSGDPKWLLLVSVQAQPGDADDDGVRTFYVKSDMKRAVQKAVAQAGAARLEVGGALQVRYVRDEPNSSGAGLPKKCYEARYTPPAGQTAPPAEAVARGGRSLEGLPMNTPPRGSGGGSGTPPATAFDDVPPF
jgi:hypothetical protein